MKKIIFAVVCAVALFFAANAFAYDINDPIGDRLGDIRFELFGANASRIGDILNIDIFSNYKDPFIIDGWSTFTGDLAFDMDGDSFYEYGVAFSDHDGFIKGGLYSVSSWYTSDDYAPYPGYDGYGYGKIVTMKTFGELLDTLTLDWNAMANNPDYKISLAIDMSGYEPPPGWDGYARIFFASANCANDFLQGRLRVVPEPISATLFLLGGGALLAKQYRKKKQII